MKICHQHLNLFIIISLFVICLPKNIELLYSLRISNERPIISGNYIFYLKGSAIKALDRNYDSYDMFGNGYRKPLLNQCTNWGPSVFFVKDCRLEMWEDRGKDTLKGHKIFERTFNELSGDQCYSTLDMFYEDKEKDVAVYNTQNNKITVFNLKEKNIYGTNDNVIGKVEMDYNVKQALIYNYGDNKSILIGIDSHNINFYNLRRKRTWGDFFLRRKLTHSLKLNEYFYSYYGRKIAGIMEVDNKKDKLLFIDYSVNLFDLNTFKSINSLYINNPTSVFTTKKGSAFIGNKSGNIYLINYRNQKLNILEQFNVCNGEILDISCDDDVRYLLVQCEEKNGIFLKHISLGNI